MKQAPWGWQFLCRWPIVTVTDTVTVTSGDSSATTTKVAADPAATSQFAPVFVYYPDRAVLKDDAVYYVHEGEVLSSAWGDDVDVTPEK